jgi:hypothetical protein
MNAESSDAEPVAGASRLRRVDEKLVKLLVPREPSEWNSADHCTVVEGSPQTSKHREIGKKDIIQAFDALKRYGVNEARFRNYVSLCLANKFRTVAFLEQLKGCVLPESKS